ncbi:MAG: type II secretion system protein GspG [Candidatus Omnitrophota bacterium]|nr:type II secretion system protein GspG [Candidatus Omnitrophota bacterium]
MLIRKKLKLPHGFTPLEIKQKRQKHFLSLTGFTPLEISKPPERRAKSLTGFTLIELLVVIAIIGIIAGMLVGAGGAARRKAMETKAQSMIASLEIAISMYRADMGNYPPDSGFCPHIYILYMHLTTNVYTVSSWQGPYMEFKNDDLGNISGWTVIMDPWGNDYQYDSSSPPNNAASFDLWSYGADGPTGATDDDITNW